MADRIELWPRERLKRFARNARTHSADQVKQIAASITEFGFLNPILVDETTEVIIAGHGRLDAADLLELADVPVIPLGHLTDAQRRAYVLADNRLALSAGWDFELLSEELTDLATEGFDLSVIGFDDDELAELVVGEEPDFQPAGEQQQGRLDEKKQVECPNCGHHFAP